MEGKRKWELLAPAGSYESMTAAFAAGADAVYIGGSRFGARAYADNLDQDKMCQAIDYAHLHGRRIYMTVNTLFKEQELRELYPYLLPFAKRGLDGVIVQDLGAMALIRECFPDLAVHASTQMTITGAYGARRLKELGAKRIVTARELSLEEIRSIHRQTGMEIECFIHGALCYCYSGQCLMSSLIGGRSGNRGRCAQPCRLPYEVKRRGKTVNPKDERLVLNLKDLCTLDQLPDILEAGVYSLKIEGRMKSPRYTAGVVSIYRKYLDAYEERGRKGYRVSEEDKKLLLDLFDRGGFTEGYGRQHNGRAMVALKERPSFREGNQEFFQYLDETYVNHSLKEPIGGEGWFKAGQEAKFTLCSLNPPCQVTVLGEVVQAASTQPVTEEKLRKQLGKTGNTPFYFQDLRVQAEGEIFLPLQAVNELRRKGLAALEEKLLALARPLSLQASKPQELRASASKLQDLGERVLKPRNLEEQALNHQDLDLEKGSKKVLFVASLEEQEQFPPALEHPDVDEIYLDADGFPAECWKEKAERCRKAGKKCLLMLPHIFRKKADEYFQANLEMLTEAGFDGIVARNLEECHWLKETGKALLARPGFLAVADASLYAWNHLADRELERFGFGRLTMPVELNARELKEKGCGGQELLIYGALPMMVSAQCVKKTALGCDGRRETVGLKDRTGKEMPVKSHCRFCYSTIYNASPLSLLGQEELVRGLNPGSLRLQFTTETPRQVEKCLTAFGGSFLHGKKEEQPVGEFTRGHIKRGVE